MSFDLVYKEIGELGLYQKYILALGWLTDVFGGFIFLNSVFLLYVPDHRCAIPGYHNDSYEVQNEAHQQLINSTIPSSSDGTSAYDKCHLFSPGTNMSGGGFSNRTLVQCNYWVYESSVYSVTLGTKLNLVCGRAIWKSTSQMSFFTGYLIGSFASGVIADRYGRKPTFYGSLVILTVVCLSIAWTPYIELYLIQSACIGCFYVGMFLPIYCIGMEFVGPSKRLWAGQIISYFWIAGCLIMTGFAYLVRDWQIFQIICAAPGVLFWSYWIFYPESPRWLYTQGRRKEMEKVLTKAAIVNKKKISDGFFENLPSPQKDETYIAFFKLFTHKLIAVRTFVLYFNWFALCLAYYALALNSDNIGSKYGVHLYFFLQMLIDVPGLLTATCLVDKVGRRTILIACNLAGGFACIGCMFTVVFGGEEGSIATLILALIGKFATAAGFKAVYQLSIEFFPTVTRTAGLGSCSCVARIGGIISPLVADLHRLVGGNFGKGLPLLIIGVLSAVAGLLAFILPETFRRGLTETIQEEIQVQREGLSNIRTKERAKVEDNHVLKPLKKSDDNNMEIWN